MQIRFYIDRESGLPHFSAHSISEDEVSEALKSAAEDYSGHSGARICIGTTAGGKLVKVVYVPDEHGVFVITALRLTGKPLKAFRRRQKRRSRKK